MLLVIGINMIKETFKQEEEIDDSIGFKEMCILAIATSIDALACGISIAFLNINIAVVATIIGVVTFVISCVGVIIGNKFGDKYEKNAKIFGGVILILIGVKVLVEHLIH